MRGQLIYLLLLLLISSCNYSDSQQKVKEVQPVSSNQLISTNKDRLLFLSFWDGMNQNEFNQIVEFENKKGNTVDGKFLLMLSSKNGIPFEINSNQHSISLIYRDFQWVNYKGNSYHALNEIPNGLSYSHIEEKLINLFDKKYKRVTTIDKVAIRNSAYSEFIGEEFNSVRSENEHDVHMQWKTINEKNDRLISLSSKFSFLDKNFDAMNSPSGATSKLTLDKENKKAKIGECSIRITYEFLDEYIESQRKKKISERKKKTKIEQERKKIEIQIDKNNSNL